MAKPNSAYSLAPNTASPSDDSVTSSPTLPIENSTNSSPTPCDVLPLDAPTLLGEFKGELDIRYVPHSGRTWVLLQPFIWCGPASNPVCYQVPAAFVTDFASIPRLIQFVLSPTAGVVSDYGRAAVIHDWLYRHGASMTPPVSRKAADQVFYEAMLCENVLWPTRFMMWLAVRLFGWMAYRRAT